MDLILSLTKAKGLFSSINNSLLIPGACNKIKSDFSISEILSLSILDTVIWWFFSFSLLICDPIDFILLPDCLSFPNCLWPAFFLVTYLWSDLWRIHFPFWSKIANEKWPPWQRIKEILEILERFWRFVSKLLFFSNFLFINSIFDVKCFCRCKSDWIFVKS